VTAARGLAAVPEPANRSGCATCRTARCCVHFDPEVTGFDLARVVTAHGLAPRAVARLRPAHARLAGRDGVRLGPSPETWLACLRSRDPTPETAADDGDGRPCAQLTDVAPGVRRCSIYPARPMRCRTFPTELGPRGVEVDNPDAICPPEAWSLDRTDVPTTRLLHLRAGVERSVHRGFLGRWNALAQGDGERSRRAMEDVFWDHLVATHVALAEVVAPLFTSPEALAEAGGRWAALDREEAPLADAALGPTAATLRRDLGSLADVVLQVRALIGELSLG
jgi:hypothetical protein